MARRGCKRDIPKEDIDLLRSLGFSSQLDEDNLFDILDAINEPHPIVACRLLIQLQHSRPSLLRQVICQELFPRGFLHLRYFRDDDGSICISTTDGTKIGNELLDLYVLSCNDPDAIITLLNYDVVPDSVNIVHVILNPCTRLIGPAFRNFDIHKFPPTNWFHSSWGSIMSIDEAVKQRGESVSHSRSFLNNLHLMNSYAPHNSFRCNNGCEKSWRVHAAISANDHLRLIDLILSGHCLPSTIDLEHLNRGVTNIIVSIINAYHKPWNNERPLWFMYGPKFRDVVQILRFISDHSYKQTELWLSLKLPHLPVEMWWKITSFLQREDWTQFHIHHCVHSFRAEQRLKELYRDNNIFDMTRVTTMKI